MYVRVYYIFEWISWDKETIVNVKLFLVLYSHLVPYIVRLV